MSVQDERGPKDIKFKSQLRSIQKQWLSAGKRVFNAQGNSWLFIIFSAHDDIDTECQFISSGLTEWEKKQVSLIATGARPLSQVCSWQGTHCFQVKQGQQRDQDAWRGERYGIAIHTAILWEVKFLKRVKSLIVLVLNWVY